jgi:hypothetical protein
MNTPKYVIVYGPPKSGKTLNKELLREFYECEQIFDAEATVGAEIQEIEGRTLILSTNTPYLAEDWLDENGVAAAIPIEEAAFLLRNKGWVTPEASV